MLALPPSGRRGPPPARTLLPGHGSYGLIRQSRSALPYFGLSLVRGVSAGCYQPLLPAGLSRRYFCESFPGCLGPCHGGSAECTCLFLPPRPRPSPVHYRGRLPAYPRQNDFATDRFFETAAISLCSGPQVCSPPRSFPPLRLIVAGRPRFLRPSRTCFVASACIGYANHLPRQLVVWGLTPHEIHSFVGSSSVTAMLQQLRRTPEQQPCVSSRKHYDFSVFGSRRGIMERREKPENSLAAFSRIATWSAFCRRRCRPKACRLLLLRKSTASRS